MRKPNLLLQCELGLSINHKLTILRTIRTMITWMLVSISQADLLVNVFLIATTTVAAKLIVYRLSKTNTQNVLARFVEMIRTFIKRYFTGQMPTWMPV